MMMSAHHIQFMRVARAHYWSKVAVTHRASFPRMRANRKSRKK